METLIGFCMIIGLAVLIFGGTWVVGYVAASGDNDLWPLLSWVLSTLLVLVLTCVLLSDRGVFDLFMGGLAK